MMEQWFTAKKQHDDAILLFRMGDFYELFGDDALLAAPILELALTSRDKDKSGLKMAGFPCHAADNYIAKLIEQGHKVAVCDQLEDPKLKKGLVKRGVTQVITPGTLIEVDKESHEHAYLLSLVSEDGRFAIAALDISTATFIVTSSANKDKIIDEILRLKPKELVVLSKDLCALELSQEVLQTYGKDNLRIEKCDSAQGQTQVNLSVLEAKAALLVKTYVSRLKGSVPAHVGIAQCYALDAHMLMDRATRENLDLLPVNKGDKSNLFSVLLCSKTAMGKRALAKALLSPSTDLDEISFRHNFIAELHDDKETFHDLRELLGAIYDLEKLTALAASNKISPRYLARLRDCLTSIIAIKTLLSCGQSPIARSFAKNLPDLSELEGELKKALALEPPINLKDGGVFREGYDHELDQLSSLAINGHQLLLNLEMRERELTQISSLKVKFTRVFGYYIEVTKSNIDRVPDRYQRKQTIANGERYITEELSELEIKLNSAQDSLAKIEQRLFEELRQKVVQHSSLLISAALIVSKLDLLSSLAEIAMNNGWIRPKVLPKEHRIIEIKAGRHPIVEKLLSEKGHYFVPNDTALDPLDCSLMLITGPNMAGKSTIMRQVALMQILMQIGSYVPAKEARISICDAIFARVGASDDMSSGRSTFMVEMSETAHILRNASMYSLILLDEIGRGTSTYDGMSIAQAVSEFIHDKLESRTLFATHYHELTELHESLKRLKNYHVEVLEKNGSVNFLYSLKRGPAAQSFGVQVAKLAGLPLTVIERAQEVLIKLEENPQKSRTCIKNQIELFNVKESGDKRSLLSKIAKLDINRITPLQALNKLQALQEDVKSELRGGMLF